MHLKYERMRNQANIYAENSNLQDFFFKVEMKFWYFTLRCRKTCYRIDLCKS
jgi:hypothetical protein